MSSPRTSAEPLGHPNFLTEAQMRQYERDNLLMVLEKTGWKIKGPHGAAEVLGLHPATLVSRIRKLGLKRGNS